MTRILFHVQHLLGIGHLKRASILARAMIRQGLDVTVLSGGENAADFDFGGASLVALPQARALGQNLKTLADETGQPLDAEFHRRRTELVLRTLALVAPHVVLIETYPFGRRAFRTELDALITASRAMPKRPAILASIRDILVGKGPVREAEIVEKLRAEFDAVLVHGDPALVRLEASFPAAGQIADLLRYTGYVCEPPLADSGMAGSGEVIVSAGGGAVGGTLLRAALNARPRTPLADLPWRLISGPNLPEPEFAALAAEIPQGVILERYRADLPCLLRRCRLSISQAGYNTVLDLLQSGVPAVVVPFAASGETEQGLRARLLAERGLLHLVEPAELDRQTPGQALAAAIVRALAASRLPPPAIAFDGARKSAELIAELASR